MSRSTLSKAARAAIAEKLGQTPVGERGPVIAELAQTFDVSVATVYRAGDIGGTPRPRKKTHPGHREWVRVGVAWERRAPEGASLDLAIEAAVQAGDLPEAALQMPLKTAERIRRELGLLPAPQRTHRLHADYPMQATLFDASTSKYLVVDRDAGFGDAARLKLHRKPTPSSGYKNKPLPADRRRLVGYAVWDMCTGAVRSRYTVSRGENAADSARFLCWALARSDDRRVVLHGVPDDLWVDQGSLIKAALTRDLLERLDIDPVVGLPYVKSRMGGVERSHRTRFKRFESTLFWRASDTITLGELNDRLAEFEIRENGEKLSRTRVDGRLCTRAQAWVALVNRRPADNPLHELPDRPAATLAREGRRRIDNNGIIRFHGVEYESTDWHARWVVVHQALDGTGDLTITDARTKEKRIARRYRRRAYGEIRAAAAAPLDKLVAADAARDDRKHADVYAPAAAAKNVVPLPARTAPARPLENPLGGGNACRDLDEAMALFVSLYPHALTSAQHGRVKARIEAAGLDRQAVVDLANDLLLARKGA